MVEGIKIQAQALEDLERKKFDLNADDEVIVRTSAEGTFTPTGLNESIKITTMTITDTESALPATALTNRNAISIYNKSATITIYIGPTGVQAGDAVGTTSGWEIPAQTYLNFDITANISLYAVAPSSQSALIKVMEIA